MVLALSPTLKPARISMGHKQHNLTARERQTDRIFQVIISNQSKEAGHGVILSKYIL
jgi:hypothetical protein